MHDLWTEELTEEEVQSLIEKASAEIKRRKMEVPAVMFLEMHKPLSFVGSQTAVALSPFLVPLFGFQGVNNYSRLFSKREYVERLIRAIESPD